MATAEAEISLIRDKEISRIKSQYPGQIKVLSCIGEFQNVVMLSFKDLDLQLKFQLTDEYPNSAASVSVRSTTLSHNQQEVLTSHLQEQAELKKGQLVMTHLADRALNWSHDNSIDLKCSVDVKIPMEALSIEKTMYCEGNHETNKHQEKKVGHTNTRKKPNFFLSLDITDENVRKNAEEVQEMLSSFLPNYADHIQPESTFHITLTVMNLEDTDQITHCSKLLTEMKPALVESARKVPPLNLQGVGNFGEGIIFARVKVSKEFLGFIRFVTESLQKGGVYICKDRHSYTPHLTLIKCPKGMKEKASHKKIAQCIHPFMHRNFGAQKLDAIHLYQMGQEDYKYIEVAVIKF